MLITKKISSISLRLHFLFYILFNSTLWSTASAPKDFEKILTLPTDNFENLRIRPGGSTLSSSIFRERSTGNLWIGKSQCLTKPRTEEIDPEMNESRACEEKIASNIYRFYGVFVPSTVLSRQQATNTDAPNTEGQEVIHIMSCKVDSYHDYREQARFAGFKASLDQAYGPVICHDSRCTVDRCRGATGSLDTVYKVEGFGKAAAVATWLHDIDFIGASATNVGYRITDRGGQSVAELIMVDPGESFSDPAVHPYPPVRHIRFAAPGRVDTNTIAFEKLFPEGSRARDEFLITLHAIINTHERTIIGFFTPPGAESFVLRNSRSVQRLTDELMARKMQLAAEYEPELELLLVQRHPPRRDYWKIVTVAVCAVGIVCGIWQHSDVWKYSDIWQR